MGIKLKIESKEDWLELYRDLGKVGLMKGVSEKDVDLSEGIFPIEVPLEIGKLVELLGNPMVKPFRKKIDATLHENLAKVIG